MYINQKPFKVYFFLGFFLSLLLAVLQTLSSGLVVAEGTQGNVCRAWYFHKVLSRRTWEGSRACPTLWWRTDTSPLGSLCHACSILAAERESVKVQNPERRCAGVGNAVASKVVPRGACQGKNRLFFSKFYPAPPKVVFVIKHTQKCYPGLYLTASAQGMAEAIRL